MLVLLLWGVVVVVVGMLLGRSGRIGRRQAQECRGALSQAIAGGGCHVVYSRSAARAPVLCCALCLPVSPSVILDSEGNVVQKSWGARSSRQ